MQAARIPDRRGAIVNLYKNQHGNATLLTVFLFAAAALTVFGLFNVGQQTTTKVRLQTISDAAAQSVATVVARDLNFKAYTNRAMVANQVAIGQLVGIASWTQMFYRSVNNLNNVTQFLNVIPGIGTAIANAVRAIRQAANAINQAIDRAMPVLIQVEDKLIMALSEAQLASHIATIEIARETLNNVVSESDSDIDTSALWSNAIFWGAFTNNVMTQQERYEPTSRNDRSPKATESRRRMAEFKDVTKASADRFVNGRSYEWCLIPFICRPPIPPPIPQFKIDKFGGSELMPTTGNTKETYQWTAMDSVALRMRFFKLFGYGSWKETLPLGWGAAHALKDSGDTYNYAAHRDKKLWGNGTWELGTTTGLGYSTYRNNNLTHTQGLMPYYELKQRGRVPDDYINLQVLLFKKSDRLRTMTTVAANVQGYTVPSAYNVEEKGGMAGNRMGALAKAGVYFFRPNEGDFRRPDGKREYGNLYNPYWQVRLLPSSNAERTAALAIAQF